MCDVGVALGVALNMLLVVSSVIVDANTVSRCACVVDGDDCHG